ncbi:MAG: S1C family serine protease [Hyphomicrobiaceae bacterium]
MSRYTVAILCALLICASLFSPACAQGDTTFFRKNGWTGSVLTAKSGTFGCLVRTEFTARMGFGLIQLQDGKWVGAFSRVGGFQRLMRWDMELLVDGRSVHRGVAAVGDSGLAILEPALAPRAVTALTTGQKLEVVTIRGRFEYALSGSADAIEAAQTCVQYLNNSNPNAARATSGTGFFITHDGRILTNAHVVRGCSKIVAGLPGSSMETVRLAATDANNDLALLVSNIRPEYVPSLKTSIRTGEAIAVYGFPLAGFLPSTGNFTLGNVTATAGMNDDTRALQVSAPVQNGNSGGPVLDYAGNAVGVIYGKINALQNVNFAIKAAVAINFLQAHSVQISSSTATPILSPADLADRAKTFTVFIICSR